MTPSFTVQRQPWGTYTSVDEAGNKLLTSLTEELCRNATEWYLSNKGGSEDEVPYDSVVKGKL